MHIYQKEKKNLCAQNHSSSYINCTKKKIKKKTPTIKLLEAESCKTCNITLSILLETVEKFIQVWTEICPYQCCKSFCIHFLWAVEWSLFQQGVLSLKLILN